MGINMFNTEELNLINVALLERMDTLDKRVRDTQLFKLKRYRELEYNEVSNLIEKIYNTPTGEQ